MHVFHENPNRIYTELTFINEPLKRTSQKDVLCFCRLLKYLKPLRQSVNRD